MFGKWCTLRTIPPVEDVMNIAPNQGRVQMCGETFSPMTTAVAWGLVSGAMAV